MKRYSIVLIMSIMILHCSYGQSSYHGLRYGFKKEIYTVDSPAKLKMNFSSPAINYIFRVQFPNNLEVGGGLGYYCFNRNVQVKDKMFNLLGPHTDISSGNKAMFLSLGINAQVGYNLKILPDFYLKLNMGFDYNPYLELDGDAFLETEVYDAITTLRVKSRILNYHNLLISNTIAFQYFTKFNLGISIFTSYHTGLFYSLMGSAIIFPKDEELSEYNHFSYSFSSRGSYWEFGIELGYRFQKKKQ